MNPIRVISTLYSQYILDTSFMYFFESKNNVWKSYKKKLYSIIILVEFEKVLFVLLRILWVDQSH